MREPAWRFTAKGLTVSAYDDPDGYTRLEFRDGDGREVRLSEDDNHELMMELVSLGSLIRSIGERQRPSPVEPEPTELVCGRFSGEPYLAARDPESGEVRYELLLRTETKPGLFTRESHAIRVTEAELENLPAVAQAEIIRRDSRERLTGLDISALQTLAAEAQNLFDNYLRQGRNVDAWQWDRGVKEERAQRHHL